MRTVPDLGSALSVWPATGSGSGVGVGVGVGGCGEGGPGGGGGWDVVLSSAVNVPAVVADTARSGREFASKSAAAIP